MSLPILSALALLASPAQADNAERLDTNHLQFRLSVDGTPVGHRTLTVRRTDADIRVIEGYAEVSGKGLKGTDRKLRWQQRVTAASHEGAPASFSVALESNGAGREVQARWGHGLWTVTVSGESGTRTHSLNPGRVDLSTVDLFDPDSPRTLAGRDYARILTAESGKIEEGPIAPLGTERLQVGGEELEVEGYEWTTAQGTYRFWYAENGFLVRYSSPLMGLDVEAELLGPAPRGIDEFAVPYRSTAVIEEIDL